MSKNIYQGGAVSSLWAEVLLLGALLLVISAALLVAKTTPQYAAIVTTPDRLAILTTPNNGPETFLYIVESNHEFPQTFAATLHHVADAAVKGAVLPDGSVLVVADYVPGRDRSFRSALFRLVPGVQPALLCDHVDYASKPLVTADGRVFVQRGTAGRETRDGKMRMDSLSIDEINPRTGTLRALWHSTGYVAYLAAAFKNDLIVYHVQPTGAHLVLIDQDTGKERILLPSLPPYANDFSITDAGDLVFQDRNEKSDQLVVQRLSLISGKLEPLYEDRMPMAPRAWPHGELTLSSPQGLKRAGLSPVANSPQGLVDISAFSSDGTIAVAYIYPGGGSAPQVALVDSRGAELVRIATPLHTPLTVAGFIP
jgi:hypothetical protein